jgi:hypothetical protein
MRTGQQAAIVSVSAKSNLKTFAHASELRAALRAAIPFPSIGTSDMEIHYLAGDCRRGMMCVRVDIAFDLSSDDARVQLETAGFIAHIEDTLD